MEIKRGEGAGRGEDKKGTEEFKEDTNTLIGKEYRDKSGAVRDAVQSQFGYVKYYKEDDRNIRGVVAYVVNKKEVVLDKLVVELEGLKKETGELNSKGESIKKSYVRIKNVSREGTVGIDDEVTVDKFTLKSEVKLGAGKELMLTVGDGSSSIKDFANELEEVGVEVRYTGRKWYNKILGYRSKSLWKMGLATIFYLFIALAVLGGIVGEPDKEETKEREEPTEVVGEESTKEESKEESSEDKAKQERGDKDKELASKEKEDKAKEEDEVENNLTVEDKLEKDLKDILGEDKVHELNINTGGNENFMMLEFEGGENFTKNMTISGIKTDIAESLVEIKESGIEFRNVNIFVKMPLVDQYGNTELNNVITAQFTNDTISKINPDNLWTVRDNLENISEEWWEHPAIRLD